MQGIACRVVGRVATLPSPSPAHTTDHLGDSIFALARGMLVLVQETTRMLSRSSEFSRWGYLENCGREGLVLMGTPPILREVAE